MEESNRGIICNFHNNWRFKDFALGMHLSSMSMNTYREYYFLISLGFWQIALGFKF